MAKIDTSALDARIDKLRKLRELADDPEAAELLAEMFRGNASTLNGSTPSAPSHKQPRIKRAYTKHVSKPKKPKKAKRTKDKPSEAALKVMSYENGMSTKEIADRMKANGFNFERYDNEVVAVNDFLRALKRKNKIRMVGNKDGSTRVKLWALDPAVTQQETLLPLAPAESTPHKLRNFLSVNGPATRGEIIRGTGLPSGSYSYYFKGKGNKGQFKQTQDGKWQVTT